MLSFLKSRNYVLVDMKERIFLTTIWEDGTRITLMFILKIIQLLLNGKIQSYKQPA